MEMGIILAKQVAIMFIMMATGYILYKAKLVDGKGKSQITNILLYLVTPCLIINTYQMEYDPEMAKNIVYGLLLSSFSIILAIFISKLVMIKGDKVSIPTERFAIIFTNCGFMGLPLAEAVFGSIGVVYCTTYVTAFNVFSWTYGLALMKGKDKNGEKQTFLQRLKPFCTPVMISVVIGLMAYFLRIEIPELPAKAMAYIASMNTPLAMVVSGVFIAESDLAAAFKQLRIYYVLFIKSFVVPLAFLIVIVFLPIDLTLKTVILIASGCPTATNTMLFANRFGGDAKKGSHMFTISTILSVISLPIVVTIASFFLK